MDKARSSKSKKSDASGDPSVPRRVLTRKAANELVRFHTPGSIRTFLELMAKEILCGGIEVQSANAAILAGSHAIRTFQVEDELAERAHKRRLGASPEQLAAKIAELRAEQRAAELAQQLASAERQEMGREELS